MTWVDGVVLAVLVVSAVLAYLRGLVQEVLGVGAWIGAIALGLALRPQVEPVVSGLLPLSWPREAVTAISVGGVFLLVLIVLKVIIGAIARRVQDSVLGSTDRALGLLFGLARGAFLVVLAYIVGGLVMPAADRWPEPVRDARALPLVAEGAEWLAERLPPEFRPRVVPPPDRPPLNQQDLMRPPARNRI
jgi:membrane protein required for colicin V production